MDTTKEVKGQFVFDGDTKRTHRFIIKTDSCDITGALYIPKDNNGIPGRIVLDYQK